MLQCDWSVGVEGAPPAFGASLVGSALLRLATPAVRLCQAVQAVATPGGAALAEARASHAAAAAAAGLDVLATCLRAVAGRSLRSTQLVSARRTALWLAAPPPPPPLPQQQQQQQPLLSTVVEALASVFQGVALALTGQAGRLRTAACYVIPPIRSLRRRRLWGSICG